MSYTPNNTNGQKTMANSSPVVLASDQTPVTVSSATLENLTDQLAHLNNRLAFLAGLQNPTDGRLRVNLADGLTFVGSTLGAVGQVTNVANQTGMGGFNTQHTVMAQMNTAANQLRQQIKTS